jgi:hypothetical protein
LYTGILTELVPEAEKALALLKAMSARSFSSKEILPHFCVYASVTVDPIK